MVTLYRFSHQANVIMIVLGSNDFTLLEVLRLSRSCGDNCGVLARVVFCSLPSVLHQRSTSFSAGQSPSVGPMTTCRKITYAPNTMTLKFWLVVALGFGGRAWEFPRTPVLLQQGSQRPLSLDDDDVDIVSGSQFHGLKTFANLPYLNCFSDEETTDRKYDIAIMGAPFDTVSRLLWSYDMPLSVYLLTKAFQSVTGRPGARFGPTGIRIGSQRMSPLASYSVYTGASAGLGLLTPLTPAARQEHAQVLGNHRGLRRHAADVAG